MTLRRATFTHSEQEDRMYSFYRTAGDLELALQSIARRDPTAALTPSQMTVFNEALRAAREMLPQSRALRDDIDEVDEYTDVAAAYRALHITLVPTLHNALPDDYAVL